MKHKKQVLLTSAILAVFAVFFYLETHLPFFKKFLPIEENKLLVVLLNINLLLILLLLFLVTRTLVKTYIEKKRGIWGSRLKIKLTGTLLIISIVPSFALSILSTGFFHVSMDKWFSQKVEDTLDNAFELSEFYYSNLFQRYEKAGALIASGVRKGSLIEKESELPAYLKRETRGKLIEYFSVHDVDGNVIKSNFGETIDKQLSQKAKSFAGGGSIREIIPLKAGELIVTGTRITGGDGNTRAILFLGDMIKVHGTERIKEIASIQKEFKESRALKKLLKYSFYVPLSLITIMTIFFSVWMGIKMAREITVPIERVKEGAAIIAKGKFDISLEDKGKDEIGTLVGAFNSMAKELKVAKEEIEAKRKYMEVILDNVATGIISTDKAGSVQLINSAARNILGIEKEIGAGTPLKEMFGDDFRKHMRSFLKGPRDGERGSITKDFRLNVQSDVKHIRTSLTTLKDEVGKTEGFIIALDDITHVVRAEKLATWREVAKKLTHEIKNPLTPIILSAERIRRRLLSHFKGDDKDILDETTSIIIKSVDDIKGIVNELTKLTHISQAKTTEDLSSIVEETVALYRNLYQNIAFRFDRGAIPEFRMDADGIKRAIINLITNSAKAIDSKEGSIVVTTRHDDSRGIAIVEVADDGVGVPDKDKGKVFDPYFTTDMRGMGLGLAIVHSIVLEHHGKIHVEDNIPAGARFIIELPIIEA
jgi:two-component system, NtrC family, nitrogen regulation sensor histidine kinase NtrY